MSRERKRLYTGKVELHNGWELRPYAYRTENGFVPELSARKHQPGSAIDIVTLDMTCCTREDAIAAAKRHGLCLVAALACGSGL